MPPMENGTGREHLYSEAEYQHTSLERRLQMLLKKPFLTESEELEIRELKKKKLYYKDIMEKTRRQDKKTGQKDRTRNRTRNRTET